MKFLKSTNKIKQLKEKKKILSSCSLSAAKFENVMKFKKYISWEFEKYSS